LLKLDQEVQKLENVKADRSTLDGAKAKLSRYRSSLNRKALRAYQEEWVQTQRDLKILDGGKQSATDFSGTDHFQSLCLLVPERGRLAPLMASDNPLSPAEMWQAIRDLHSLSVKVCTVFYLPGREPVEGACPVAQCNRKLTR
jgi:hypothetical protein